MSSKVWSECPDCRRRTAYHGRCYDCAQRSDPSLPARTISPASWIYGDNESPWFQHKSAKLAQA